MTARSSTKPTKPFAGFFRGCLTSPMITSNRCWRSPKIPGPPAPIRAILSTIIFSKRSKTAVSSRSFMAGVKLFRHALVLAFLLCLISAALPNAIFAAAAVRVGYPQPSGAMLPIWVMSEAKLAQKYGIELQNIYISGGARLTQTLVSGDIDIAATGGAVIKTVLSGAEMTHTSARAPTHRLFLYARRQEEDCPLL